MVSPVITPSAQGTTLPHGDMATNGVPVLALPHGAIQEATSGCSFLVVVSVAVERDAVG